jgi:hypothetical protein
MRKGRKGGCALSVALRWSLCCGGLLESRSGVAKVGLVTQISLSCSNPQIYSYLGIFLAVHQHKAKYTWWTTPRLLILGVPFSHYSASVLSYITILVTEATRAWTRPTLSRFDALPTTTGERTR